MAIPKKAKRVFKGIIFDVYHWPQRMFDGGTRTFERLTRPDSINVIATVKDKIVILQQQQPGTSLYFDFIGGRRDPGETAQQAAARELAEETGFKAGSMKLLRTFPAGEGHIQFTTYLYLAKNCRTISAQHLDGGEKIKLKYLSYAQFLKIIDREDCYFRTSIKLFLLRSRYDKKFKAQLRRLLFS